MWGSQWRHAWAAIVTNRVSFVAGALDRSSDVNSMPLLRFRRTDKYVFCFEFAIVTAIVCRELLYGYHRMKIRVGIQQFGSCLYFRVRSRHRAPSAGCVNGQPYHSARHFHLWRQGIRDVGCLFHFDTVDCITLLHFMYKNTSPNAFQNKYVGNTLLYGEKWKCAELNAGVY